MKTGTLALIVIVALVLVLGGCGCSSYNNLVRGDQSVKSSWSNVETNFNGAPIFTTAWLKRYKVQQLLKNLL